MNLLARKKLLIPLFLAAALLWATTEVAPTSKGTGLSLAARTR